MKHNIGSADRLIRLTAAVAIVALYLAGLAAGTAATVLLMIALILVGTSLVKVCPLYIPLGIRTNKQATPSK